MFFKWLWITLFWGNFEPPKICLRKDFNFSHVCSSDNSFSHNWSKLFFITFVHIFCLKTLSQLCKKSSSQLAFYEFCSQLMFTILVKIFCLYLFFKSFVLFPNLCSEFLSLNFVDNFPLVLLFKIQNVCYPPFWQKT